jgi:SAM-dependent methyltransferase
MPNLDSAFRTALDRFAGELGGPARETIVCEYYDKHLLELRLIDGALGGAGGSVLDIGGGLGVNLHCLKEVRPDVRAVLVDRFEEYTEDNRMGSAAAARPRLEAGGVEVVEREFWPESALPFDDGTFDVVTLLDVVEHLPGSPIPLLREAKRLLRPGGTFLLSGPNAASLMSRLKLLAGRHPHIDFDAWLNPPYFSHYREFTRVEYRAMLERAGFSVRRTIMSLGPWPARARNRYHRRRRSIASPVTWAIYGAAGVEWLLPPARHSVYCVGVPT